MHGRHSASILLAAGISIWLRDATAAPVALLVDTDMSTDVDDVGALCAAHALQTRGEATIVAVVHDAHCPRGVGAVSSINTHFGRAAIPVGAYTGNVGSELTSAYVDPIVERFPGPIRNASEAPPALTVYRRALAAAADSSVVVASIGFATNLLALLRSPADTISPLGGRALVAAKVRRLAWMGGRYGPGASDAPEWNFGMADPQLGAITNATLAAWPPAVPIVFLGWEVGSDVHSGAGQPPEQH